MLEKQAALEFCRLRRQAILLDYSNLNEVQQQAVVATDGPLLLLAGAGSGKTTVLIHRIANLIAFGSGGDSDQVPDWVTEQDLDFLRTYVAAAGGGDRGELTRLCALEPVAPWSIIAITFTNKAAGELKERLEKILGLKARDVWAATFHSACVRILRRDIQKLGLTQSFTIYDSDDSLRVIKDIMKSKGMDDKTFPPRTVLGYISRAKDEMLLAGEYMARCKASGDIRLTEIAKVYASYEKRLWESGALDFDDIILHTVRLLEGDEETRRYYQNKFRYVLIDEYQDTNHLQYRLASLLAGGWGNICVVGDDDQSIYRFRGATIENILSFEKEYKGTRVIRLEQNYRSTKTILAASNAVIRNNQGRKGKELWTDHPQGDKLQIYTAMNEHDEAHYVANQMLESYQQGRPWKSHAVLYRMNAQSNQLEVACKRNGIPYRIVGGTRYFDRAEVKDMVAYLCLINNHTDALRLTRIINNPPRGIGPTTLERAQAIAAETGMQLWDVVKNANSYPDLQKAAGKLAVFVTMIEELTQLAETMELPAFYEEMVARTGYGVMLEGKNTVEDQGRLENVRELLTSINGYIENSEALPTLAGFLDEIALYTDLDSLNATDDCITMMTMHAAKGLEFPLVFLVGVEEGIFPGLRSIGEPEEMEEERRLCYVAMTRAKERLYLTSASQRMLYGKTSANRPSRFVAEIPEEYVERSGRTYLSENENLDIPWERSQRSGGGFEPRGGGFTSPRTTAIPGQSKPKAAPRPVAPSVPLPNFQKGEMITHKAFGRGMVLSVQKMGGDALIEIAFDNVGTKRLMLKSAAPHMEKES